MDVRLLRGEFFKLDGLAIQDFEALPLGPVATPIPGTGFCDLYSGSTSNGGCSLEFAILLPREP